MVGQSARPEDGEPALVRVLRGERAARVPVWLMRQAGRYLPEYREVRAKAGSFLDLCFNPELAAEVTLQPLRRFDLDAAILFSDILVVPHALGQAVSYVEGEGPRLPPIDRTVMAQLRLHGMVDRLAPVMDAVARIRAALPGGKALIGFCGGPWTVATYMVVGAGSADQAQARLAAARDPGVIDRLVDILIEASSRYLVAQLQAGAQAVQLFDSWAGVLDDHSFGRWVVEPTRRIVAAVRAAVPGAPIIGFPKGAGLRLKTFVEQTGVDAVGVDWTTPLAYVRDELQPRVAVQGNLDPMVLVAGGAALDRGVERILGALGAGRFIFNLGHGIVPETPIDHVTRLIERIRTVEKGRG